MGQRVGSTETVPMRVFVCCKDLGRVNSSVSLATPGCKGRLLGKCSRSLEKGFWALALWMEDAIQSLCFRGKVITLKVLKDGFWLIPWWNEGFWWLSSKESACNAGDSGDWRSAPQVGKIPWRRKWPPASVFLPGQPQGQRSLAGYSPWDHKESDTSEQLEHARMVGSTHVSTSWVLTRFCSTGWWSWPTL